MTLLSALLKLQSTFFLGFYTHLCISSSIIYIFTLQTVRVCCTKLSAVRTNICSYRWIRSTTTANICHKGPIHISREPEQPTATNCCFRYFFLIYTKLLSLDTCCLIKLIPKLGLLISVCVSLKKIINNF